MKNDKKDRNEIAANIEKIKIGNSQTVYVMKKGGYFRLFLFRGIEYKIFWRG